MIHNYLSPKYPKKSRKVPLVLWSGGADSTYLVHQHMLNGRQIDVVAGDPSACVFKLAREEMARIAISRALILADLVPCISKTARASFTKDNVGKLYGATDSFVKHAGFTQILPWINVVLRRFDPRKHSHVEFGYVCGDQAAVHLVDIAKALYHLGMILHGEPVKACFPLAFTTKERIYSTLNQVTIGKTSEGKRRSLLDLTWVCETPGLNGHCGGCMGCVREAQVRNAQGIDPRPMVEADELNLLSPFRYHACEPELDPTAQQQQFERFFSKSEYPELYSEEELGAKLADATVQLEVAGAQDDSSEVSCQAEGSPV